MKEILEVNGCACRLLASRMRADAMTSGDGNHGSGYGAAQAGSG